jgi:hypothetical protein
MLRFTWYRLGLCLAMIGLAGAAAAGEEEPELPPRYLLSAFDSKGRDLHHYSIDNEGQTLYITDLTTHRQLWRQHVGGSRNYTCLFKLFLAPDGRHAVLSFDYNPHTSASLFWITVPQGKRPLACAEINLRDFSPMAAAACSMPGSSLRSFYFNFLNWSSNDKCRIKWECTVHGDPDDLTNAGIAEFNLDDKLQQKLEITSFLKNLTGQQCLKIHYGSKVTLRP